jgi:predicted permease
VLLIGCANVANLLLARVAARRKEMAVRAALGATRWRLVRQLLVECSLVSLAAGALGLLLAAWGTSLLSSWSALKLPPFVEIYIDGRVLLASVLLSLLTGLIFGLVPAWESAQVDLRDALNQSSAQGGGLGRSLTRRLLVVAEVSLSLMLLIGAGLMLKSFQKLTTTGLNFRTDHLLTLRLDLRSEKYSQPQARVEFAKNLVERAEAIPGVESAVLWGPSMVGHSTWVIFAAPEGQAVQGPQDLLMLYRHSVNPGGLGKLGIPLLRGRDVSWQDTMQTPLVALISESLARRFWPNEDAIGKRFQISSRGGTIWFTVVGITADARLRRRFHPQHGTAAFNPQLDVFLPYSQRPNQALIVALRTKNDPASVIAPFRQTLLTLDSELPAWDLRTLADRLTEEEGPSRALATLMSVYALLALFLATLGIYSVLAHAVTQRTREIGIRVALGARPGDVLKLVVRQGMILTLVGVAIGLIGAWALTRMLKSLLFSVSTTDPITLIIVPAIFITAALLASYLPARRAARVDPMIALRYE